MQSLSQGFVKICVFRSHYGNLFEIDIITAKRCEFKCIFTVYAM